MNNAQKRRKAVVIVAAGFTIRHTGLRNTCYALLPGEEEFCHDDEAQNHNYLGMYDSLDELLDDVAGEIEETVKSKNNISQDSWNAMSFAEQLALIKTTYAVLYPGRNPILQRFGIAWQGEKEPITQPMPDGYWTPWHIASNKIEALQNRVAELERQLEVERAGPSRWRKVSESLPVIPSDMGWSERVLVFDGVSVYFDALFRGCPRPFWGCTMTSSRNPIMWMPIPRPDTSSDTCFPTQHTGA